MMRNLAEHLTGLKQRYKAAVYHRSDHADDQHDTGEDQQKSNRLSDHLFIQDTAAFHAEEQPCQHDGYQKNSLLQNRDGDDAGYGIEQDAEGIFSNKDKTQVCLERAGIFCDPVHVGSKKRADTEHSADNAGQDTEDDQKESGGRKMARFPFILCSHEHFNAYQNNDKAQQDLQMIRVYIFQQKNPRNVSHQNEQRNRKADRPPDISLFPEGDDQIGRITKQQFYR